MRATGCRSATRCWSSSTAPWSRPPRPGREQRASTTHRPEWGRSDQEVAMRGELDDALARLERWDEVRRQLNQETVVDSEELLDEVVRVVTGVLSRRGAGTVTIAVPGPQGT